MHVGLVGMDGTKMSKSLGNLVFVSDLLKDWEPGAIRLAISAHHYRQGWEWNDQLMPDAADRLERWRASGSGDAGLDDVRAAIDDDLDTPGALRAIDKAAASGGGVSEAAALLGIKL
jgi:L-cysteine:1D-myo-inositol 2-amino-2-deoxy-alpha-D-glucopyranoside ligase